MPTFRCILFALTALCVVDGHLLVGQSVAWLLMIGDRAPQMGLQEAVADTFSGQSPCEVCRAIKQERQEEREETPIPDARPEMKFAPVVFSTPLVLPAAPDSSGPTAGLSRIMPPPRPVKVPTPPPRVS